MRFEPSEEAMYRRMDQKERILFLIAACGLIGSLIFLLGVINQNFFRSPARSAVGTAATEAGTVRGLPNFLP